MAETKTPGEEGAQPQGQAPGPGGQPPAPGGQPPGQPGHPPGPGGVEIPLEELLHKLSQTSLRELVDFKEQTEVQIRTLTSNLEGILVARKRFESVQKSIQKLSASAEKGTEILAPLTQSVYVRAKQQDTGKVLIDIGAQYYVEESVVAATAFCERRLQLLNSKLGEGTSALADQKKLLECLSATIAGKVSTERARVKAEAA